VHQVKRWHVDEVWLFKLKTYFIKAINTITKKDYAGRKIKSESVINFLFNSDVGSKWWSKEKGLELFRSHYNANNKSRFTALFGKYNFTFTGEVKYYAWEFEFKGRKFLALTDADNSYKGTNYEIILNENENSFDDNKTTEEIGKLCTEFADEMCKTLKSFQVNETVS